MYIDQLKEEVISYCNEIGIDKVGFASADVFTELKERLKRQQELKYQSGFEKGSIEERTDPKRLLPKHSRFYLLRLHTPLAWKTHQRVRKKNDGGFFAGHHGGPIIM